MKDLHAFCSERDKRAGQIIHLLQQLRTELNGAGHNIAPGLDVGQFEFDFMKFQKTDCDSKYRIAVAGAFNTGKSYFLNALIGRALLPTGNRHLTLVPTVLRRSSGGADTAHVRYLTAIDIQEILARYAQKKRSDIHVDWPKRFEDSRLSKQDAQHLAASVCDDPKSREYESIVDFLLALGDLRIRDFISLDRPFEVPIQMSEVPDFVDRQGKRKDRLLAGAVIINAADLPFQSDVELTDLPGTDADDPWAKHVALRAAKDADAVVLVTSCDRTWNDAVGEISRSIRGWGDNISDRVFVVVNRADQLDTHEKVRDGYSELTRGLGSEFATQRIFFTSAETALSATKDGKTPPRLTISDGGIPELRETIKHVCADGGVNYVREKLTDFLDTTASKIKMHAVDRRWKALLERLSAAIQSDVQHARHEITSESPTYVVGRYRTEFDRLRGQAMKSFTEVRDVGAEACRIFGENASKTVEELAKGSVKGVADICARPERTVQANDVVRGLWLEICASLESQMKTLIRANVLGRIEEVWNRRLKESLDKLSALPLQPPLKCEHFGLAGNEPVRMLDFALSSRLIETVRQYADKRPYRLPRSGQYFEVFKADFLSDVSSVIDTIFRDAVESYRKFTLPCIEWIIDDARDALCVFCARIRDDDLIAANPESFRSLVAPDDSVQKRRVPLMRLIELSDAVKQNLGALTPA